MKDRIAEIIQEFSQQAHAAHSHEALEKVRVAFLGRSGVMATLMAALQKYPIEEKRIYGPLLNTAKQSMLETIEIQFENIQKAERAYEEKKNRLFDVTAYQKPSFSGGLHLYSQVIQKLEDVFISMGYTVVDGPEVETDFYNFEALNIPEHHPARDMQDTFWLNVPNYLLRTQTSNVQIRAMQSKKPPLAIFAPGLVYRNEALDASHEFMFIQSECLFIDKHVSMAHLIATARRYLHIIFGKNVELRIRPGYFPFVEPGIEIDAECPFCLHGCSVCKHTRWLELLGAGLVHPNVLRAGGIDPNKYSGFAFGSGLERALMITYGIDDIRLFKSNKMGFLQQF